MGFRCELSLTFARPRLTDPFLATVPMRRCVRFRNRDHQLSTSQIQDLRTQRDQGRGSKAIDAPDRARVDALLGGKERAKYDGCCHRDPWQRDGGHIQSVWLADSSSMGTAQAAWCGDLSTKRRALVSTFWGSDRKTHHSSCGWIFCVSEQACMEQDGDFLLKMFPSSSHSTKRGRAFGAALYTRRPLILQSTTGNRIVRDS